HCVGAWRERRQPSSRPTTAGRPARAVITIAERAARGAGRAAARRCVMPRGDKSKYSAKQKRKAEHIAEGYKKRGTSKKEAKRRAWATVNAMHGGGEKSGSGRGKPENKEPARKGGRKGGRARKSRARRSAR